MKLTKFSNFNNICKLITCRVKFKFFSEAALHFRKYEMCMCEKKKSNFEVYAGKSEACFSTESIFKREQEK